MAHRVSFSIQDRLYSPRERFAACGVRVCGEERDAGDGEVTCDACRRRSAQQAQQIDTRTEGT
jgi:hypothetical protein